MSDERANLRGTTERVVLDGPAYDMLVAKVVLATKDHIDADASRSRAKFAVALTVGGTLFIALISGVAGFAFVSLKESLFATTNSTIQKDVPNEVEAALDDQLPELQRTVEKNAEEAINRIVQEQIKPAREAWDDLLLRAELRELTEEIAADWFKPADIDRVIEKLHSSSSNADIRGNDDFLRLLERVIDYHFENTSLDSFRELEAEFKPEILESPGMLMTMTTWYGLEIAGFEVMPKDLAEGGMKDKWTELASNYQSYAEAMIVNGYPEIPLVYDLVLACMQDQPAAVAAALISRIDDLTDTEFDYVIKLASRISDASAAAENSSDYLASQRSSACARAHASTPGLSPRAREMLDNMIVQEDEEPPQDPSIMPDDGGKLEL